MRQVSLCGFTAGLAFLNVPCGETSFYPGDAGYLYWELTGNTGTLLEGGLQYNSDSSVQPYMNSTVFGNLTMQMNDYNEHYTCGVDIGLMHGATYDGSLSYTQVGLVPSSCTPEYSFCDYNKFTLQNAAWLWWQSPGDYNGSGDDYAGAHTPCKQCTISRVTSIGQGVQTYSLDGSYFGVISGGPDNYIQWMQVAFGEWASNCTKNSSLCTFVYSAFPPTYYGGPQYYPDDTVSSSKPSGLFSYGPYETYDGVDLSGFAQTRSAAGAFNSQLPPPPCTVDAYGYCSRQTDSYGSAQCQSWHWVGGTLYKTIVSYTTNFVYGTYTSSAQAGIATETVSKGYTNCSPVNYSWSPGEPKVTYNDPNLP